MIVTSTLFEAYLKCHTKCFLKSRGETNGSNTYAKWVQSETEIYHGEGRKRLF